LNCALQVLFHCPHFRSSLYKCSKITESRTQTEKFNEKGNKSETWKDAQIVEKLIFLYKNKEKDQFLKFKHQKNQRRKFSENTESVSRFIESVRKVGEQFSKKEQQHDVQEFLRFLLGHLQDFERENVTETNKLASKKRNAEIIILRDRTRASKKRKVQKEEYHEKGSFVEKLFQGNLQSNVECLTCHHVSAVTEPFLDISVSIQKDLECALKQYVAQESLSGKNKYDCANCKAKRDAKREILFSVLPPILTVHLKRFCYDKIRKKVSDPVACPMYLNLGQFSTEDCPKNNTTYGTEFFLVFFTN